MDREQLHEAMRFGAFQEYSSEDLGKYGLGLKTASLSQCHMLTVASKAKPQRGTKPRRCMMRWDLKHVHKTDDWDLLTPESEQLEDWENEALSHSTGSSHGTVVLWSELDEALPLLNSHDAKQRERFLASLIDEVTAHLRMVFHRFIQGSVRGRRKVTIRVCGDTLKPWDPFCRNEKTRELDILKLSIGDGKKGHQILVSPFVLPRENEFSSPQSHRDAAGPRNWNFQQGFYFYRNNRLLQAGGWSNLRAPDEHTKLLRVAVDFPGELDKACALNVTKMRARIPAEIREQVKNSVSRWAKTARERYDRGPSTKGSGGRSTPPTNPGPGRPTNNAVVNLGPISLCASNTNSQSLTVAKGAKAGAVKLVVPGNHDCAEVFKAANSNSDLKKLCFTLFGLLEAVVEKRLAPSEIPLESLRKFLRRV
jgi:hypothetical protein